MRPVVAEVPFGECDPVVQPEQVRILVTARFDENHHIVDGLGQLARNQIQCIADQLLEAVVGHGDRHTYRVPRTPVPITAAAE